MSEYVLGCTELTEGDEADAYHQLSLIGVSASVIAKQTGRTRTAVESALKAKASDLKHVIDVPESAGSWVVMEEQATLDELSLGPAADILPFTGHEEIDRAAAFSNDRNVTTRVAEWLRGVTLDDGSELAGVRFKSRVGNGTCWAHWMRRTDLGLTEVATAAAKEPAMAAVTEAWEIRTW